MYFEWDEIKNRKNFAKHGITFELAQKIFENPTTQYIFDMAHSDNEERWLALGPDDKSYILAVFHTYREKDGQEIIRLISARKADKNERKLYERRLGSKSG